MVQFTLADSDLETGDYPLRSRIAARAARLSAEPVSSLRDSRLHQRRERIASDQYKLL
jgi:hypothetical protein